MRLAKHQWLVTIILVTTWEAEIKRIAFQSQFRQIIHKTLSQPIAGCSGA
jgi:hypothetical protein